MRKELEDIVEEKIKFLVVLRLIKCYRIKLLWSM